MKHIVVFLEKESTAAAVLHCLEDQCADRYLVSWFDARLFIAPQLRAQLEYADVCITAQHLYGDILCYWPLTVPKTKLVVVCTSYNGSIEHSDSGARYVFTTLIPTGLKPYPLAPTSLAHVELRPRPPRRSIQSLGYMASPSDPLVPALVHLAERSRMSLALAWNLETKAALVEVDAVIVSPTTPLLLVLEWLGRGLLLIPSDRHAIPGPQWASLEDLPRCVQEVQTNALAVAALQRDYLQSHWSREAILHKWAQIVDAVPSKSLLQTINVVKTTPLCEIMGRHGSDKGSIFIEESHHNYTTAYYKLFKLHRKRVKRVFEMGIGTTNLALPSNMGVAGKPGASLHGWAEFFPHATVVGADIDPGVLFQTDRIQTVLCDQTDPARLRALWDTDAMQEGFDVILDDGLHTFDANVLFFEHSIHKLNPGGYFVIEDIDGNTFKRWERKLAEWRTGFPHMEFTLLPLPCKSNIHNNNLLVARNTLPNNYSHAIDQVVYINLAHRTDRREHMEQQLGLTALPADRITRFEAVAKPDFGILGCVESHIAVLELALEKGWEWTMVLEDDFTIRSPGRFLSHIESFLQQHRVDVFLLSPTGMMMLTEETAVPRIHKVLTSVTTSGYVIHASYLATLLANFRESRGLLLAHGKGNGNFYLDVYWQRLMKRDEWYTYMPTLGYQYESHSDIAGFSHKLYETTA